MNLIHALEVSKPGEHVTWNYKVLQCATEFLHIYLPDNFNII